MQKINKILEVYLSMKVWLVVMKLFGPRAF